MNVLRCFILCLAFALGLSFAVAQTDLLYYDPAGEGAFYATDGNGNIQLLKLQNGWRHTWSIIVPGDFGVTITPTFSSTTPPKGAFYATDGNGNIQLLKLQSGWRHTWSIIVPGTSGVTVTPTFSSTTQPRGSVLCDRRKRQHPASEAAERMAPHLVHSSRGLRG